MKQYISTAAQVIQDKVLSKLDRFVKVFFSQTAQVLRLNENKKHSKHWLRNLRIELELKNTAKLDLYLIVLKLEYKSGLRDVKEPQIRMSYYRRVVTICQKCEKQDIVKT
eukprot:403370962